MTSIANHNSGTCPGCGAPDCDNPGCFEAPEIFIRFIREPEHARHDLKRGWSCEAASDDREYLESLPSDCPVVECPEYMPKFALQIDGLCGYGPYDCLSEAEEEAQKLADPHGDFWQEFPYVAFYKGEHAGWDGMAGDTFYPAEILKIMEVT